MIEEVVSTNAVKLQLPTSMRIHLVANISQIEETSRGTEKERR